MKYLSVIAKILTVGFLILVIVYAWNNLLVTSEKRYVGPYTNIQVSGPLDLIVMSGKSDTIIVEADDYYLDQIITTVENGTLSISTSGPIRQERVMRVAVEIAELDTIITSGPCTFVTRDPLITSRLYIHHKGAAELKANLQCDSLILQMDGSANAQLAGVARNFRLNITGYGDLMAYQMASKKAVVSIHTPSQSSGTARIHVMDSLRVDMSGTRLLKIKGDPWTDIQTNGDAKVEFF